MTGRSMVLAAAVAVAALAPATVAQAANGACEKELQTVERVVPSLVLTGDLRREVEALQTQAGLSCQAGEAPAADAAVEELWQKIVASDDVTPPTVVELTVAPCSEGIAAVEQAIGGGNEIGEMGRGMARTLVEDARQLCQADDSMAAEQKLALAWSILAEDEEE